MHPALSVILFTVASGAGFGMLALVGLGAVFGLLPEAPAFAWAAFTPALALAISGLVASTFHLGHPERAWRAFSQWRSSWLSREGILAVVTFAPALILAAAALGLLPSTLLPVAGALTLLLALATLLATGMIYASLRAIPRWANRWTAPCYIVLGLMSGALLLNAVLHLVALGHAPLVRLWLLIDPAPTGPLALLLVLAGLGAKLGYWWSIDHAAPVASVESATGLPGRGPVRLFETPHTAENFVMKEMGFRIARKHAKKLRRIAIVLGFMLPALLVAIASLMPGPIGAAGFASVAAAVALCGLLIERWLFFAEAKHVVTLYYGAQAV